MKILWVTNMVAGDLALSRGVKLTSGQWLNAEIDNEKRLGQNEIIVCTSGDKEDQVIKDNIKYIVLPHGNVSSYTVTQEKILDWKKLYENESPDIILIWGTEYDIGKCALIANDKKIPSIIYIQGVMCSIAKNYRGGLSDIEIAGFTTLLERVRKTTLWDLEKNQQRRAALEKECIMLADGVILENDWAEKQYKEISSNLRIFKSRLPIKKEFAQYSWQEDEYEPHAIVTTAANYPLKGLHKLLEAIKRIKEKYADVKLYVPGPNNVTNGGFRARVTRSGYCRKIANDIKKYDLEANVIFTGPLTTLQYAQRMKNSNVFVTASAVENHCSALREAMSVGVPCISSRVGGIPEYAIDGENCSLYDYSDTNELFEAITELFESKERRLRYSENGKSTIYKMYTHKKLLTLNEIYQDLIDRPN